MLSGLKNIGIKPGEVEFSSDQELLLHPPDEGRPHINAGRFDLGGFAMMGAQITDKCAQRGGIVAFVHVNHRALFRIRNQGGVVMVLGSGIPSAASNSFSVTIFNLGKEQEACRIAGGRLSVPTILNVISAP
ncbi:MAG TPA: hypothetical protein VLC91_17240 [Spongiibacteraceae bacterium]|nr:hypothetical protein [Spongiibacteraceae bacterium]